MTFPHPQGASRESVIQALKQAIKEAIQQERADRLAAMGGEERVYPRPLRAGPQAYADPKIWSGHEDDDYQHMLELMAHLESSNRSA